GKGPIVPIGNRINGFRESAYFEGAPWPWVFGPFQLVLYCRQCFGFFGADGSAPYWFWNNWVIVPTWTEGVPELNLDFRAYCMALSTRQPFRLLELFLFTSASITLPSWSTLMFMTTLPPSIQV